MTLNRRQMLFAAGAAALGAGALGRLQAAEKGATKRVLFFTKSSGFQHSAITRNGDQLGVAERILTEVGKEHGFEVVASKDGRMFDPDKIDQWDAFAFYTTGDLTKEGGDKNPPMSKEGEQALYEAIRAGKGFMGMHSATDTFGHHRNMGADDPYIQMIGAEFIIHGAQQEAKLDVVDEAFPGAKPFGASFKINDEWYALKNWAEDLHVIMAYDTASMNGAMYKRPNFPQTWARSHGKGRVFYTSMGHREDVWENPKYQGLLMGALGWISGKIDAEIEPNIKKATPGYNQIPA